MSIGIGVNHIEGEEVARHVNRNGAWTQIAANLDRSRLGCRGACLAPHRGKKNKERDVFGGTPNTAAERSEQHKSSPLNGLTALPMDRISEYSRLLASIRGYAPFLDISASAYASR
jgi:hypothetical protein